MALEQSESADAIGQELDGSMQKDKMADQDVDGPESTSANPIELGLISRLQEEDADREVAQSGKVNNNEEEEREVERKEDGEREKTTAPNDDPDMRLDLGYTEDDPPPEYDVTERVRQLNKELANDPTPTDDRERSIKFKEKLIDFEAPPPEYGESDNGEDENVNRDQGGSDRPDGNPALTPASPRSLSPSEEQSPTKGEESEKTSSTGGGDQILVERGGKFQLISDSDLSCEEKQLYGLEPLNSSNSSSEASTLENSRPATANGNAPRSRANMEPRSQSAMLPPIQNNADFDFNYVSPYALSNKEKDILAKQKKQKEKDEKKKREQKSKNEGVKKEDADVAFQVWLRRKRDQAATRRKQEEEMRSRGEEDKRSNVSDREDESHDPDGAFSEWMKVKRQQKNQEKNAEQQKQREIEEGWSIRPRTQCNQAFKEWMRKKQEDLQRSQKEEKQKVRVHRLLARRCRKSMALARAIKVSQSFRYVDYYGYR